MKESNGIAYSEVYEILNLLEDEYLLKVPKKLINMFKEQRDLEYKPQIDLTKPLEEQKLKRKTIVLLAMLNLNYWCDNEKEKKEFLEELKRNEEYEKSFLEEAYDIDNLFKKGRKKDNKENLELVQYKDKNFIQKILNRIIGWFKGGNNDKL